MNDASDSPSAQTNFAQVCESLFALRNEGSRYGLQRIQALADALGNPEKQFSIIHVAGTNGKGSVCAMLEALYRDNKYKTGLYNSPHLLHLGERIQVNRKPLNEAAIINWVETIRPFAKTLQQSDPELQASFFEYMTAMAFAQFARSKIDLAFIETGLGGRLDATNIVTPELSIITSISLDHTDLLGETLTAIAREKGGIIKPGKPVLLGKLPAEAESELRNIAKERNSKIYALMERFPDFDALPETNLHGTYQRYNAGLALFASEIIAQKFPIKKTDALKSVDWAGRWQRIQVGDKTLILDATHNPEGAEHLRENLSQLTESPIIIAGTLGLERGQSLVEAIAPFAKELCLVEPNQPRAVKSKTLKELLPANFRKPVHSSTLKELFPSATECTVGEKGSVIVVTGSIYLIGEVLARLQNTKANSDFQALQDRI